MIFVALLFYAFFLIFGFYLIGNNFFYLKKSWQARKWEEIVGRVTEIKYKGKWQNLHEDIAGSESIQLAYEYQYHSKDFRGERLTFDGNLIHTQKDIQKGRKIKNLKEFHSYIKKDNLIKVWVNPQSPKESIILNKFGKHFFNVLIAVTFITWGIGCATLLTGILSSPIDEKIVVLESFTKEERERNYPCENASNLESTMYMAVNNLRMNGQLTGISQESDIAKFSKEIQSKGDSLIYATASILLTQSDEKYAAKIRYMLSKEACDYHILEEEIISQPEKVSVE